MKELIENLYPIYATLVSPGYDSRLEYLKHLHDFEITEIQSGTQLGTWTVPNEWIVKEAWVKDPNGKKIIDFSKEPLSLITYSLPFNGKVDRDELMKHLHYYDDRPDVAPHVFKFYDRDWGFCVKKDMVRVKDKKGEFKTKLKKGKYEVFIDVVEKPGVMKIATHTIKGKTDKEILLFAHLDHPYQANDNLSGVACLVDLIGKIDCEHTVKVIFCPETIGSIAYAYTHDLSNVDFVISVDICGNEGPILFQKSFDPNSKINKAVHCALQMRGKTYRKAPFRSSVGSDETVFNDPEIGVDGILLSKHPYPEYHTNQDTPDKIHYESIEEVRDLIIKIIEIYEKDFIPKREFVGPLMRSRYNMQSISPQVNLNYDYFFYHMDGKKSLVELCADFELNFDSMYNAIKKIEDDKQISRVNPGEEQIQ